MRQPPSAYSYDLPETLIARRPASPRDSSRLFVYDTARDAIAFDRFSNLGARLPPRSLLVFNETRVVPARAILRKETGGKVEALFLVNEWRGGPVPVIVDRRAEVGRSLHLGPDKKFLVTAQKENIFYLKPLFPAGELIDMLQRSGITPIPKYIGAGGMRESELRKKYQSVFAARSASVAAPTASLHFTERLLAALRARGIRRTFVTLDVGLGTFAPVKDENVIKGTLHKEFFDIPAATARAIRDAKTSGSPVVAVGTTVVRTLESQAPRIAQAARRGPIAGTTDIFIRPPYRFRIADALITNFHLPGTSLMMLVQAFLLHKGAKRSVVDLYNIAIAERFRFYSFGDAMLVV
ncbi:MAG TPA: tRNA preQ1(34) S-adenosylmethionine ribosyltransferase-isomerase QueA [Candidatus Paceibacterota bacterium]|nr:tRNA preQ1(34) S-adenosylmethionine ribosyltransferase-isomerase QueA [Candidatus Paceibacterota bacterium]